MAGPQEALNQVLFLKLNTFIFVILEVKHLYNSIDGRQVILEASVLRLGDFL